jgi:hypothetical protein
MEKKASGILHGALYMEKKTSGTQFIVATLSYYFMKAFCLKSSFCNDLVFF